MNIKALLFFVFISFYTVNAQTTAIPDTNFEQKLITLGIDTNGVNGNILNADALSVTTLTLSGNTITNLTGLQAFTNVVTLDLGSNLFATAPLNALTVLENLKFTNNSALTSLNLSQNTALKKLEISGLSFGIITPIATLNLTSNINLEVVSIRYLKNLTNLSFPITPTLIKITIYNIADPTLNFSSTSGLQDLTISESMVPVIITLPNVFVNLKKISISDITIPTINLGNFINLETIRFSLTYVENLILPVSTTLTDIYVLIHNIQNPISFASLPNLKNLDFTSNGSIPLQVNITQNLLLEKLDLAGNDMTTVNLTQNTLLKELRVSNNNLTTLNVTQNTLLENIFAGQNRLPTINISQNLLLRILNVANNLIPTLNINVNVEMIILDISNNLFTTTGLNLTNNIELLSLKASFNQIQSLNITQNARLSVLILDHNLFVGNNNIINQYYNLRLAEGGISASQTLDVSFNQLSGSIPNLASLVSIGNNGVGAQTNYFEFHINNNNFQFGDFEAQHLNWISFWPIISPVGNPVLREYNYAPQAKVNLVETPTIIAGNSITLTTIVSGAQNHYRWFKNNVAIVGAPDSPNYIITSVNPCDAGVYYCEVRSDLVPFENANLPGTDGKNLVLVRNNITLTVTPAANACANLTLPLNAATNVAVNTNITWADNPNACGYRLRVGTTAGGTQILNNVDVGNVNLYNLPSNLPINTPIFVQVIPYPASSIPVNCPTQSFTTGSSVAAVPNCVTTINPLNNAVNIPVNQNFSWTPVANATGYTVIMGTTPGGAQIAGATNLVTNTFNPTGNLPQGQIVYFTITPFNADGNAIGCSQFQFTVETIPNPPTCPTSYSIANNATNVSVNLGGISWASVSSQTIYNVSIGTTPGGTQFVNYYFNNTSEFYSVPTPFAYSTTYYLTITVEDQSTGNTTQCPPIRFTTEPMPVPDCTTIVFPANNSTNVLVNSNIIWNASPTAIGYRISIGTNPGGIQFLNNFDNGNLLTYNPPTNFAQNTTYYVTIRPYNSTGNATGCGVTTQFTTQTITAIPNCTTIVSPANNATSVLINANITWNAVATATGYFISILNTSTGTQILNNFDNGNATTYNPPTDFAQTTNYNITITPYNSAGNATGCTSTSFTTQTITTIPNCTTIVSPANNATNVLVNASISWNAAAKATGYIISIGSTSGGTQFLNNFDNGNLLTYNPAINFNQNATYFVSITPYNSAGNAAGCASQSFTTETIVVIPTCTNLIAPSSGSTNVAVNSNISWNAIANATGYFISITETNTSIGNIVNMLDVGNVLNYNPTNNFTQGATVEVLIIPYNSMGNAISCTSESFSIGFIKTECAYLNFPNSNDLDVPIDIQIIVWDGSSVDNYLVEGYYLTIGLTPSGGEILNNVNVGNGTGYSLLQNLPYDSIIYVTVVPFGPGGTANNCGYRSFKTEKEKVIITPKFFTPNNDGYNDTWEITDSKNEATNISIFDRFGKLLKYYAANSNGWNGNSNGETLPSTDYWYSIELKNGDNIKGHFALKR